MGIWNFGTSIMYVDLSTKNTSLNMKATVTYNYVVAYVAIILGKNSVLQNSVSSENQGWLKRCAIA